MQSSAIATLYDMLDALVALEVTLQRREVAELHLLSAERHRLMSRCIEHALANVHSLIQALEPAVTSESADT